LRGGTAARFPLGLELRSGAFWRWTAPKGTEGLNMAEINFGLKVTKQIRHDESGIRTHALRTAESLGMMLSRRRVPNARH